MSIKTINPSTGNLITQYEEMSDAEIKKIIENTHKAFIEWREINIKERIKYFATLAANLRKNKNTYAELMAQEMGKPLAQGVAEIEKCAVVCEYYASNAEKNLEKKVIQTELSKSYITYQPLGVILAIMPWNFPFWQVFRFAVPTLISGNSALLKHAPISTGTALVIEKLFKESGFLDDLFRTLVISEKKVNDVITNSKVMAVTLTGSTHAGSIVSSDASKVLKKSVLELGGSDPYLILADADLEIAATACITSRMLNSGQSCIAAKRLIVIDSIKDHFLNIIQEKLKQYTIGDPFDLNTMCGPLARKDLRDHVHQQVQNSIAQGATLMMGGALPLREGFFYPPTLITNVKKGMPAYDEEIFGPVIAIINAKNEEEAIMIANDNDYGLGAAIFSQDIERAEKIAVEKIQSGTCVVNTYVASDARLPFGGIKQSGYGRELSIEGLHSFVNVKTIHIK